MIGKKVLKFGIINIILVLTFLITLNSVKGLGVTRPIPYDVELMPGEEAGFVFEIQAVTSTDQELCTYSISGLNPLIIEFDQEEVLVNPGSIKKVYGTVTAPEDVSYGNYQGTLSVSCGAAATGISGSMVKTTIGGSPFNVDVVQLREGEIRDVGAPEVEAPNLTMIYIGIIIIVVAAIIIIGVYYFKFKKKR